jgi:aldehyde:ferredoxin oxidoreductase
MMTVEIREASLGKDTGITSDLLMKELDPSSASRISVLTIQAGGREPVKYAHALNDDYHSASRCGVGAVWDQSSKAVAVRGPGQ